MDNFEFRTHTYHRFNEGGHAVYTLFALCCTLFESLTGEWQPVEEISFRGLFAGTASVLIRASQEIFYFKALATDFIFEYILFIGQH